MSSRPALTFRNCLPRCSGANPTLSSPMLDDIGGRARLSGCPPSTVTRGPSGDPATSTASRDRSRGAFAVRRPAYATSAPDRRSAGCGYLLKERVSQPGQLADAVRTDAARGSVIDPAVVDILVAASSRRHTYDYDVPVAGEQCAYALTDDEVVVGQDDGDRWDCYIPRSAIDRGQGVSPRARVWLTTPEVIGSPRLRDRRPVHVGGCSAATIGWCCSASAVGPSPDANFAGTSGTSCIAIPRDDVDAAVTLCSRHDEATGRRDHVDPQGLRTLGLRRTCRGRRAGV